MNNTITLYNLPWVFEGRTQPYFNSFTSRDNYFNSLVGKSVNKLGVNVNFRYNYEIEITVDVDYTEIENYNFVVIEYNSKRYFANIIDINQISINRVKIACKRNVFYEVENPFNYFKDFNIEKTTFKNLLINNNPKYYPEKTLRESIVTSKITQITGRFDAPVIIKTVKFVPCMVLILSDKVGNGAYTYSSNETQTNYYVYVTPLDPDDKTSILKVKSSSTAEYFDISFNATTDYPSAISEISPYIISVNFIKLPFITDKKGNYYTPFYGRPWSYKSSDTTLLHEIKGIEVNKNYGDYDFTISVGDFLKIPFVDIVFGDESNTITLEMYRYNFGAIGRSSTAELHFLYDFSPSGISFVVTEEGNGTLNDLNGNIKRKWIFPINCSDNVIINSEALFNSQNKYYDVLTKINKNRIIGEGTTQSVTQILTGAMQIAGGAANAVVSGGTSGLGEMIMGAGNGIRGVGSIAETAIKSGAFEKERKYNAMQEKEKPSTTKLATSATANLILYNTEVWKNEHTVIENDYESLLREISTYGVNAYINEDKFDIPSHLVDNHFYIQGIAVCNPIENQITARQYSEVNYAITNGTRFRYFQ